MAKEGLERCTPPVGAAREGTAGGDAVADEEEWGEAVDSEANDDDEEMEAIADIIG